MKVLHVGPKNFPPAHGGTERVVYNLVKSIKEIDFYVLLEWEQEESEKIFILPQKLNFFAKTRYIFRLAKKNGINLIHFHNEKYIPIAVLLSFVFRRVVLTVHGVHFRSPKFTLINRVCFWIVDVLGAMLLPRMVFCSEYDQKTFGKYLFFRKTYFVNNGTFINKATQDEKDIQFPDTYIYLGRITPAKNIINLIASADKRGIKVHIYGVLDKQCPKYCALVLDKVRKSRYVEYKGVVPYNNVIETMKKYKAFLSITIMEGLPLSVLEAASCGMFLILSDIPHHLFLHMPKVKYVAVNNPQIPYPTEISTGKENKEHVSANFSSEKMAAEYMKIYNSF